jgi:wyosine [tRNA(Phe)-imidazoG37] synthetase (radical SAM superfamily)
VKAFKSCPDQLMYHVVQQQNILPLTSECNTHCIFCSHLQNPKELLTYYVNPLPWDKILSLIEFLQPYKKIVIGESASNICEGEPFTHPLLLDTLKLLRKKYPKSLLQITTNGTLLTESIIKVLKSLEPIELYVSVNSIHEKNRKKLMAIQADLLSLPQLLKQYRIKYHGSIVAMPSIIGWTELEETITYLAQHGAETIRVFKPGYSQFAKSFMLETKKDEKAIENLLQKLRLTLSVPLTLEPQILTDLDVNIIGVIQDSPAAKAGLRVDDIILSINGEEAFSRVEAFHAIARLANPRLLILRNKQQFELILKKDAGDCSGLVVDYDLALEDIINIERSIYRHQAKKPWILASVGGYALVKAALKKKDSPFIEQVFQVPNNYFGGSIISAGLLVVEDFKDQIAYLKSKVQESPDVLIIPMKAFDYWGKDLRGISYLHLEQEYKVKVELV